MHIVNNTGSQCSLVKPAVIESYFFKIQDDAINIIISNQTGSYLLNQLRQQHESRQGKPLKIAHQLVLDSNGLLWQHIKHVTQSTCRFLLISSDFPYLALN